MQIRIYSALPEKEKQVLFELVQECNKVDGGYRLPYLDNNYNTDPEMPAFFVAEMGGRTIGFLSVYADEPGQAEVSLCVLPSYRRQGVANQLLAPFAKGADQYDLIEIEYVAELVFLNGHPDFARRFDYQTDEAEIWLAQPAQAFPLEEREGIEVLQGSLDLAEEIAAFQSQVFETPLDVALKYAQESISSGSSLLYILKKDEGGRHTPFSKGYKPQFYFRTTDVTGEVELPADKEMVMPGDNVTFKVKLQAPIAMEQGLNFAIREGGRTVGAGVVTNIIK